MGREGAKGTNFLAEGVETRKLRFMRDKIGLNRLGFGRGRVGARV